MDGKDHGIVDYKQREKFPTPLREVEDFFVSCPPFDLLPPEVLGGLCSKVTVKKVQAGTIFPNDGGVFVVRSGVISTSNSADLPMEHYGPGDIAGIVGPAGEGNHEQSKQAVETAVLYIIPRTLFAELLENNAPFASYFIPVGDNLLRGSLLKESGNSSGLKIITSTLNSMVKGSVLLMDEKTTIRKVAEAMDRAKQDSVLLLCNQELSGILTDHDLRSRVVAKGLSTANPVSTVMTPNPATLEANSLGIDAILLMARLGIEHIPVVEGDRPIGVITAKNLSSNPTASVIYLVREIYRRHSLKGLKKIAAQIPAILVDLTHSWMPAHNIGHLISSITDALNIRLLQLAEAELGPPPVPYNWVVVGSLGRCEQTAVTDQDSLMLFDNDYDEAKHGAYFSKLAKRVCNGMNELGYVYCPGEIMAQTTKWRQPLKIWKGYFRKWIAEPEPKALMLSCVFFDLRSLYGKKKLFKKLEKFVSEQGRKNQIYLAHMAANALTSQPPLGFFNNFSLVRGGIHNRCLNMKQNGVIPIVDLARIYALSAGRDPINTVDRLKLAAERNIISREGARDLLDAFELISITRLRYQARLIKENKKVVNYMPPKLLSNLEQEHLKDAFAVIQTMQAALRQHYQTNSMG
jgi:CBS domain-containing protein